MKPFYVEEVYGGRWFTHLLIVMRNVVPAVAEPARRLRVLAGR